MLNVCFYFPYSFSAAGQCGGINARVLVPKSPCTSYSFVLEEEATETCCGQQDELCLTLYSGKLFCSESFFTLLFCVVTSLFVYIVQLTFVLEPTGQDGDLATLPTNST